MERHREVKRGSSNMAANNGLTRRRPRNNNSLRDSPEEDGGMELQETSRLRDRGGVSKKDRDRINRNKRRRADRLIQHHHHHSNHNRGGGGGDGGEDESSDDNNNNSLDDDDEDEDEEAGPGPVRMRPPTSNSTTTAANNNPSSSSLSNHSNNNHHQLHHRKSFPPVTKVGRTTTPWKVSDEMGFSVPKKARSVSTKRSQSHECWLPGGGSIGGGSGELTHRQASTSPARPNSVAPPPPSSSMAPASPSSSSASIRKKMKPIGQKHRPPKVSSSNNNNNNAMNNNNKPSSVQDDIEIEVAEVLYGLMRQSQCPTRQDVAANSSQKLDSRDTNGSNNDAKSRVSSPVSASPSSMASKLPQNSSSSNTPMSAVAPKRKRPRPTRVEEENSAVLASKKIEIEQSTKPDAKSERISGSAENFTGAGYDFGNSPPEIVQPELANKPESSNNTMMDSKNLMTEESMDQTKKVVVTSPKKESSSCAKVELDPENATATKATPTASVVESHREESFKFDLMEPPSKSSPERDSDMGFVSESKSVASDAEMKMESEGKGKDNVDMDCKKDIEEDVVLEKKRETMVEESDSHKSNAHVKHTMLDLDLEKHNKDCGPSTVRHQPPQIQQQHQSKNPRSEPKLEKAAPSTNSLPLPMNLAGWPAGLPPVGNGMPQVRPQGMASLDGNSGSSNSVQPPGFLLSQPRPKRCATHYYVARNIYYHQQFTKMNPFWPAAAGPASLYGKQPYNLNVLPPTETAMIGNPLLGSFPGRNLNPVQEKSQPDGAKDKSSVAANFMDSQPGKLVTKQMVLQQPQQQAAIHGPTLIFPMNQQQAAVATNNKAGAPKSSNNANATSSVATQSAAGAPGNTSSMPAAAATTMSFNYPNMPGSEAQYVAILQNSGYPFPVPAHVGAQPTPFRGTPQAMPFFNGSFYSSQMLHPSQIQQQQQQQQLQQQLQQAQTQQVAVQQGHQNTSTSSGSSSSQKHHQQHNQQQSHQQRLQSGGGNAASGNSTSFNASKNRTQKPQNQSFPVGPQVRQHEADVSVEDSPSTEDSRVSQAHKNAYNHNFAMPIHQKNFASMSSAALTGGGSGNHSERQQHQQQQNIKGGPELVPNQAFAMPFASFNAGTAVSGLDFSSMAQNHVIFQSLPEAARHSYQQMAAAAAAAQAAQHKKTHQIQEEGKTVSDSNNADDERKMGIGKAPPSIGQAIVFSRPESIDPSVTTLLGNSVVESSARTLNLISSPGNGSRSSRSGTSASVVGPTSGTGITSNAQQHHQQQQHQQQVSQYMQLQKQQQQQMVAMHQQQQMQQQIVAAAAARGKPTTTSSSNVYPERHSSSSMAAKYPNAHYYPEVLAQGGSSTQSPQWKNTRTAASPVSSPSLASSTSSLKNLAQQQGRSQQSHTQISFGGNSKPGSGQHGQQIPTGNQSPSSPVVVGSPPTSVSKSAGGSPRASSTGSKVGSTPSLSSQQAKNTSSGPSRKSSPVGGRNAPSNLGNSHVNPAQCSTTKSQSHHHQQQQQQQQQQHLQQQQQQQQKQNLQQGQLLFTNMYMQAQSPQSTSNTSNTSGTPNIGYYQQRRQPAEQQQQQQPGPSNTVSSGMLTLSPSLTLAGATNDPTKAAQAAAAAAAAAANMKGGLPPPGLLQAAQYATQTGGHQFMSAAFPYLHSVPGVQVKPSEQKQPAGNDNLRASWQPEKR